MSEELKSAFEIDGFINDQQIISNEKADNDYYQVINGKLMNADNIKMRDSYDEHDMTVDFYLEKRFKKVESKKVMYIHEYWSEYNNGCSYVKKVRTDKNWGDFAVMTSFELIKTTDIEE